MLSTHVRSVNLLLGLDCRRQHGLGHLRQRADEFCGVVGDGRVRPFFVTKLMMLAFDHAIEECWSSVVSIS